MQNVSNKRSSHKAKLYKRNLETKYKACFEMWCIKFITSLMEQQFVVSHQYAIFQGDRKIFTNTQQINI